MSDQFAAAKVQPIRKQTAGGIQVSSRYLAASSVSSAASAPASASASSSSSAAANSRKRPAPDPKPASSSSTAEHAPSKRAKKSTAPAPAPKTLRKNSLAPTSSSASTAVIPRRRATAGPTGSSAADRELLQLAASLRTRPDVAASSRRDTTTTASSNKPSALPARAARKSTAAAPTSRKSAAAPASASRKSSKPASTASSTPSAPAPVSLSPIPLDPSWTNTHTHSLHRLLQWTYLTTSTAHTHAADHDSLRVHLTRAADLIDMRTQLLAAVCDRVKCENLAASVNQVKEQTQRVCDVMDRIESGRGFCAAHARLVRAVQSGVDLVDLQGDASVSDVDVFVNQVRVAGEALERVVGALDGEALQEASKQVDVLLANTARLVEAEERERRLTAEAHGIELRAKSLAVTVPGAGAVGGSVVGTSVMESLGLLI